MARKTVAARIRERQFTDCRVPGCPNLVTGLSRWCNRHALAAKRTGSPVGRTLRGAELAPYRRIVSKFCDANAGHPALVQAFADLDQQLRSAAAAVTALPDCVRLKPRDWQRRRLRELARLHAGGMTGERVFRAVGSVWLLTKDRPGTVARGGPLAFAVARAVLRGLWTRHTQRLSTLVLAQLGAELLEHLGSVLRAMDEAIQRGRQAAHPQPTTSPCMSTAPF